MIERADKLKRTNNNMDAIRYVMAFSVVIAHFNELCGFNIYWPISSATGVGGFFTLSGFLIFNSYQTHPALKQFLFKRALRILPPYFFIIILCAFLLVAVSSISPDEYFLSPGWWKYLAANISFLNFLHPQLPGVFDTPQFVSQAVNGSLWTMKIEWCLYLSVPIVAWLIIRLKQKCSPTAIFISIIVFSAAYSILFHYLYFSTGKEIYNILSRQFFGQLSFFYVGVLAFHHLDLLLRHKWTILQILIAGLAIMQIDFYIKLAIRPIIEGGLVIWFSMIGNWGSFFSRHDNVSYDIYLFHFPIIQLCIYFGIINLGQWPSFFIICIAVIILASLSWNFIGLPFQKLKHKILDKNSN